MWSDESAETFWKWLLRALGVIGFGFLLVTDPDAPVAFYVLLGGLLGLPNVIQYQLALNRQNKNRVEGEDGDDAGDAP